MQCDADVIVVVDRRQDNRFKFIKLKSWPGMLSVACDMIASAAWITGRFAAANASGRRLSD
jgi:hypothetical protein